MMINKKVTGFLMLFLLLFIFALSGCADKNNEYIKSLNNNFNGDFKFAEAVIYEGMEDFTYTPGFGGYTLESIDGLTSYNIGGYPDSLDAEKLIYFTTEDTKYKVFGFSVGASITTGESALTDKGYALKEELANSVSYELGKIIISLTGKETIEKIFIRLEVTNKKGVDF